MERTLPQRAVALVGPNAVLLPIQAGTKKPMVAGWQRLTLEDSWKEEDQRMLSVAGAVAVLLGPPSRHLVVVDLDENEAVHEFFACNPKLGESLQTRGNRGVALWLRMSGAYPDGCRKLRTASGAIGEWRAGNCYQIIAGKHPEGMEYRVVMPKPAAEIAFCDIQWPPGWQNVPTCQGVGQESAGEGMNGNGVPIQKTSSAWETPAPCKVPGRKREGGLIRARCLELLHEEFIAGHWTPRQGERNHFVSEAIPFLHHAICDEALEWLVMSYYDDNVALWHDSRGTHESEMRAHLKNVERRFVGELLGPHERSLYARLETERLRSAFRICRHLGRYRSNRRDCEGMQFVMAYGVMGTRLLIDGSDAKEIMLGLAAMGVVEIAEKGCKRQPGVRPKATVWRWCL